MKAVSKPQVTSPVPKHELKVYKLGSSKLIASIDLNREITYAKVTPKVQTVIVLDRSGSMGHSVQFLLTDILPKCFTLLGYDPDTKIHLIAFDNSAEFRTMRIRDMPACEIRSRGGTEMAPAVRKLQKFITKCAEASVHALRILTISDGEVFDRSVTKSCGEELAEYAAKINIAINSQAVRFFTSFDQPDTTALCSLLQLGTADRARLIDVSAHGNHEEIAADLARLFDNDGLAEVRTLVHSSAIFYKLPWVQTAVQQLTLVPGRKNVFWLDSQPTNVLKIGDEEVTVTTETSLTFEILNELLLERLDFIVDHMKVLMVVDSEEAKATCAQIVEYFTSVERQLMELVPIDNLDPRLIENRARLMRLNAILKGRISALLSSIANNDRVSQLNAAQKADFLRNVQATAKSGRGLAKRAAKSGKMIKEVTQLGIDEVVRRQVFAMKANFDEIKDIDDKRHQVSFYSQATTLEGIRSLIELTDDPIFATFSAEDILAILNLVGVACAAPIGDFPDASAWRVNELHIGCYVSVADIVTAIQQSNDAQHLLQAPGTEKTITCAIPVFDDARIGVFLKRHAPSLLEFAASIGMRRMIAAVPMTFGHTIIAGVRRLAYDLVHGHRTSAHIETFVQLVESAASFVGGYFKHLEALFSVERSPQSFFLANSGLSCLIVPLIRVLTLQTHATLVARKNIPAIMRAIYGHEMWRGMSREFRESKKLNDVVRAMLHQLLSIDIKKERTSVQPLFTPEPKKVAFSERYAINKEYLKQVTEPMRYLLHMAMLPALVTAVAEKRANDIKTMPALTPKVAMEAFGIDYNCTEFVFFNVFQALRYPRGPSRADMQARQMKLIDVRDRNAIVKEIKTFVRTEFEALYRRDVKVKRHSEEKILANCAVESILTQTSYEAMTKAWSEGVTRENVTFKLKNTSSIAFKLIKKKMCEVKAQILLRSDIIRVLLLGVDKHANAVYNEGEVADVKKIGALRKAFVSGGGDAEEWKEIESKWKSRESHMYRAKANRHGHGCKKPSYWAKGYSNFCEYLKEAKVDEQQSYMQGHTQCCGMRHLK